MGMLLTNYLNIWHALETLSEHMGMLLTVIMKMFILLEMYLHMSILLNSYQKNRHDLVSYLKHGHALEKLSETWACSWEVI